MRMFSERSEQQSSIHEQLSNKPIEAKKEMYFLSMFAEDETFWLESAGRAGCIRYWGILSYLPLNHCFLRKLSPAASWAALAFECEG